MPLLEAAARLLAYLEHRRHRRRRRRRRPSAVCVERRAAQCENRSLFVFKASKKWHLCRRNLCYTVKRNKIACHERENEAKNCCAFVIFKARSTQEFLLACRQHPAVAVVIADDDDDDDEYDGDEGENDDDELYRLFTSESKKKKKEAAMLDDDDKPKDSLGARARAYV